MDLLVATLKFVVNFIIDQLGAQLIDFLLGLF
jgi:hypothetical protein